MDELKEKLKHIAELTRDDVGRSEENVKQKIAVPLLECLGHNRNQLDFEYGSGRNRIDIFIKDIPRDCKVIIDTKNYDEDLNKHLEQMGQYAFQEGVLLAIFINGEEIRIYDPFIRGLSFEESLLYTLKRIELTNPPVMEILYNILSRENLKSRKTMDLVKNREQEIKESYSNIEEIKDNFEKKKIELSIEKEVLNKKINEIRDNIEEIEKQIAKLESERNEEINKILKLANLPKNDNNITIVFRKNKNRENINEAEIFDLMSNGLIKVGQRIYRNYKGKVFEAEILSDGKIKILKDGSIFDSPSMAAKYLTNTSINGWVWWKFKDADGYEHILDELRTK